MKIRNFHFKLILIVSLFLLFVQSIKILFKNENKKSSILIKSKCNCRKNIELQEKDKNQILVKLPNKPNNYTISLKELNQTVISCNYYNYFLRGKNIKVLTYSLYGKSTRYYEQLKNLPFLVGKYFPEWIMRIYHDDSIDKKVICEFECLSSFENVDFCDIKNLPKLENIHNLYSNKISLAKMHSMMWRWYLIGDLFVDVFMSRDSDSLIIQREVDSVNAWLKSDKLAHIMRDHHWHKREILGGMWGFYSSRNRQLANRIFEIYSNETLIKNYNLDNNNKYDLDQKFLADVVYSLVKNDSIIHDSYFCDLFENTLPFPTKRNSSLCHVGFIGDCTTSNIELQECPINCRPKNHLDWNFC